MSCGCKIVIEPGSHDWGGAQSDPINFPGEWIRYCKRCGIEDTCEDPLPQCPEVPVLDSSQCTATALAESNRDRQRLINELNHELADKEAELERVKKDLIRSLEISVNQLEDLERVRAQLATLIKGLEQIKSRCSGLGDCVCQSIDAAIAEATKDPK